MGKLHIGGIPEPINMPDDQLKQSVEDVVVSGNNGKSITLSGYTDAGVAVTRIGPETPFMAQFDELDLEAFLGIDQDDQ